ncbi:MAG: acyl carrier protein [Deltaproteobacteria bacterium]|nr:acyl carrier protein [Deltaproteobacteria bacterium]
MKVEDVLALVVKYFNEQFEIAPEKIKPEAHLFKDLGLDSIDALDMVGYLEAELDLEIQEDEIKSIRTVQDVVDFILRKSAEKA